MIYISVDNDHQASLAFQLIAKYQVPHENVIFISHISRRNTITNISGFHFQSVEIHPLCAGNSFKKPLSYVKSIIHQSKIKKLFKFKPDDTLIVTTEYELNNAFFAQEMYQCGGNVYLYDEGIGFYFNNSPFHDIHTSLLDKIFLLLYNLAFGILGIPAYARKGFEGRMYVCIKDVFVDRIYSRMRLPINRPCNIRGYRNLLASEEALKNKNANTAIFFANNLSCFGLKDEELVVSGDAIKQMALSFEKVYIKIHPSDWIEKNDIYCYYQKLVETYANVYLIDNSMTGNDAIELVKPNVVVGAMGAVMFDALFFGCQPVFLFQFLPTVKEFEVCRFTLDSIGYRYIKSMDEIMSSYQSNVDISSLLYEDGDSWL